MADNDQDSASQDGTAAPQDPPAPPPVVSLTPEQIRATPEYQALLRSNRQLGRDKASSDAALATMRTEAEEARQAAEAQRTAALETQLQAILGSEGQAAYAELADLSQSDPMAAALRVAELMAQAKGQTPPAQAPAAAGKPTTGEEVSDVAANASASAPPPPSSGVDGGAPLGQASTGQSVDQIIADLTKTYSDTVARNQNLASRNRVTMRDRAAAMIAYIGGSYLKAGAKPKSQ